MRSVIHEERILQDPITAAVVVGGVFAAGSLEQQRQASRRSRRAQRIQQRQADVQTARERRNQIRQARIQRALTESQGVGADALGSSALAGATGSIQSQLASNVGFLNVQQDLSRQASAANIGAARAATRAGIFSSVSNLALTSAGSLEGSTSKAPDPLGSNSGAFGSSGNNSPFSLL